MKGDRTYGGTVKMLGRFADYDSYERWVKEYFW